MAFDKNKYKLNNTFIDINAIKETIKSEDRQLKYIIPLKFDKRPDLIAYNIYGDVTMQDYLAIINDIKDCPEGFYAGRTILVIKPRYKDYV